MSLLNSILSSINPDQPPPAKPSSSAAASTASTTRPNPVPRRENGVLGTGRAPATSSNLPPKRKAEDVGRDMMSKAPRVDSAATLVSSVARSATNSPAQRQGLAPPPRLAMPYRGTVGHSKPTTPAAATAAASKTASGTSSAPPTPMVAPKSGYLATLERAKAAQLAAKKVGQGQIQHKPVEKLTKKDRLRMLAEATAAQKGGKAAASRGAPAAKARSKSAEPLNAKTAVVKKDRKPVDLGYKGTMRNGPTPLAYSGTMRPSGSAVRKPQPTSSKDSGDRYRYASYSDEEEEDVSEQEDYETDSDMEAGMDEVDAEEEEAARIARREDAAALREESELKRAKMEKKRRLDQLAAAAKKKGTRY